MTCDECGATYTETDDSCARRFDQLLALDHSWREPWGSRHGLAFAVFALQHQSRYDARTAHRSLEMLTRFYLRGESMVSIVRDFRARGESETRSASTMADNPTPLAWPRGPFAVTIADLGEFEAATYPEQLDAWCRATLRGIVE